MSKELLEDIKHHHAGIIREMDRIYPLVQKYKTGEYSSDAPYAMQLARILREAKEKLMDIKL